MKEGYVERPGGRPEGPPELIGKITILRHGDTDYSKEYPGISEKGIEQMRTNVEEIKAAGRLADTDDVLFVATPMVRAQGSVDVIKEGVRMGESPTRIRRSLRSIDVTDQERANEIHKEHRGEGSIHDWENKWASDDLFDQIPDVFEPRSSIDKRSARSLSHAIRMFTAYHKKAEHAGKVPHVVAVAHFEVLYKFVCDVFQMDPAKDPLIRYGERIEVDVLSPKAKVENDPLLEVVFRGERRVVRFDIKNRKVIQL